MADTPDTWHLLTEDGSTEPHSLEDLKRLACVGTLTGDAALSATGDAPWTLAAQIPQLELEWVVRPEAGDPLPPCHVMALRDWVEHGSVQPFWEIDHLPSGERYDVVDALCSALLAQNRVLEVRLGALGPSADPEGSAEDGAVTDAVERLLSSLELKSRLLAEAHRRIATLEEERDRVRESHEEAMRSSERLRRELTDQVDELDEALLHLTRRYRDLNDRLIQTRNQSAAAPPA